MRKRLTEVQESLLKNIEKFINENGFSPTVRELCKMTKKSSPATVKATLDLLQEKGYITFLPKQARTIRIVNEKV